MEIKKVERGHYIGQYNDCWTDTSYFVKEYSGEADYFALKKLTENALPILKEILQEKTVQYEEKKRIEQEEYKKLELDFLVIKKEYDQKSGFYRFFNLAPEFYPYKSKIDFTEFNVAHAYVQSMNGLIELIKKYENNEGLFAFQDKNDPGKNMVYLVDNTLNIINARNNNINNTVKPKI